MIALDIETTPDPAWAHYEDAALDKNRNKVTFVALWSPEYSNVLTGHECSFDATDGRGPIITHNGKFDFGTLIAKRAGYSDSCYAEDTMLMAVALSKKIPQSYLAAYDAQRTVLNKLAGKDVHRRAGRYSLKTLAPYFLGVEPFWEDINHGPEYALKDAEYTYRLYFKLKELLEQEGSYEFYKQRLMPWSRMLLRAEMRGIALDMNAMAAAEKESEAVFVSSKNKLDEMWLSAHESYFEKEVKSVYRRYDELTKIALEKSKNPLNAERIISRYQHLCSKARDKVPTKINFDSPPQMAWLLKDHLGLDISTFNEKDESTGKAVLQRLAGEGREDIKTFLEYRKHSKLLKAFYPSYREMSYKGRIFTSFNLNMARTGRTSSNGPNMQQVPGHLHKLFVADKNEVLINFDLSGIEPVLVAYFSECPELCRLLIEGGNFHNQNLRVMLGIEGTEQELSKNFKVERDLVKEVGLALLYGARDNRIRESAQKRGFKWDRAFCKQAYNRFHDHYRAIFDFKERLDEDLHNGKLIRGIFGRPVVVEDAASIHMTGFNTLIQGSASDMLLASIEKAEMEMPALQPLLFVHDETITAVDKSLAEEGRKVLESAMTVWKLKTEWGYLPLKVEGTVGPAWVK